MPPSDISIIHLIFQTSPRGFPISDNEDEEEECQLDDRELGSCWWKSQHDQGGDFENTIIAVLKVGNAGKDAGKKKKEATSS